MSRFIDLKVAIIHVELGNYQLFKILGPIFYLTFSYLTLQNSINRAMEHFHKLIRTRAFLLEDFPGNQTFDVKVFFIKYVVGKHWLRSTLLKILRL